MFNKTYNPNQTASLIIDSLSNKEIDRLGESEEYADFVMENCTRDRPISNGEALLCAIEDGYLFDEFLIDRFV